MFEDIKLTVSDGIAVITLSRPEARNAFTTRTQREMIEAAHMADEDDSVRVVVLTGAGGTFCAGADIKEVSDSEFQTPERIKRLLALDNAFYAAIRAIGKPVIARIEGFAVGGGCILAQMCDLRIAADTARLGFPFVAIGLSGADGGIAYHLPRLIGYGRAGERLLIGDQVSATEAASIGLITRSVPASELDQAVAEMAATLRERSPVALRNTKDALYGSLDRNIEEEFDYEALITVRGLMSEDWIEGTRAFKEGRAPRFLGR